VGPLLIFSISLGDANGAEILKVAGTLKSACNDPKKYWYHKSTSAHNCYMDPLDAFNGRDDKADGDE
jgi:hypothetical protein